MEFPVVTRRILPSLIFGMWDSRQQGFQSFSRMMSEDDAGASWMELLVFTVRNRLQLVAYLYGSVYGYRVEGGVCGLWPVGVLINGGKMDLIDNEERMALAPCKHLG